MIVPGLMRLFTPFESIAAKIQKREVLFNKEMLHAARSPEMVHEKAIKELGYNPRPAKEAFQATFEWFKKMGWVE